MGDIQTQLPVAQVSPSGSATVQIIGSGTTAALSVSAILTGNTNTVVGTGTFTVSATSGPATQTVVGTLTGSTNTVQVGSGTLALVTAVTTLTNGPATQTVVGTLTGATNTVQVGSGTLAVVTTLTNGPATQTTSVTNLLTALAPTLPGSVQANIIGAQYNTVLPTFTATEIGALQCNANGELLVSTAGGVATQTVVLSGNTNTVQVGSGTLAVVTTLTNGPATQTVVGTLTGATNTVQVGSGTLALVTAVTTLTNGPATQTIVGTLTGATNTVQVGSGTLALVTTLTNGPATQTTLVTNLLTAIAPTLPGSVQANVIGAQYNTVAPTFTATEIGALQCNASGQLLVSAGSGTFTVTGGTGPATQTVVVIGATNTVQVGSGTLALVTAVTTLTNGPATQTVVGTLTGSTNTVQVGSGTLALVTAVTTLTNGPAMQTVAAGTGTFTTTTGEIAATHVYTDVSSLASAASSTILYTATGGTGFFLKTVQVASSGGPCKFQVAIGSSATVIATSFYSAASPAAQIFFTQPYEVPTGIVLLTIVTNNATLSQDMYCFINGRTI